MWTERAMEVRGSYEIRLSTTALAAILASGHPAMAAIQVLVFILNLG